MERRQEEMLIHDLMTTLYQKGYRGRYELYGTSEEAGMQIAGNLSQCLKRTIDQEEKMTGKHFLLKTRPPYNDKIRCSFKVELDEVKGFSVREMDIHDQVSGQRRHYRIDSHRMIPGSNAIEGLFPKPRPWENIIKGKFRRKM